MKTRLENTETQEALMYREILAEHVFLSEKNPTKKQMENLSRRATRSSKSHFLASSRKKEMADIAATWQLLAGGSV